jgi:quinol monooxygenase YgiN
VPPYACAAAGYAAQVLVVTRYHVKPDDEQSFRADATAALRVLTERVGCLGATLGRAVDEPTLWTLTTTWRSVGAYRRALSNYDVKLVAVPLMYRAIDEPSAFEPLLDWAPVTGFTEPAPIRAPDADRAGPGRDHGRSG